MTTVVISAYRTVKFLEGGGHFWVYMQYVEGLRQAGCQVYWLEFVPREGPWQEMSRIESWLGRLKRYGFEDKVILYTEAPGGQGTGYEYLVSSRSEAQEVFKRADLLLNFHYAIDGEMLAGFRRTALVDIDPGLLQTWMSTRQVPVLPHDLYLTTGETVGTPAAPFPDLGVEWVHIRPPVCLQRWPYIFDARSKEFTTVTNWWGGWETEMLDGREVLYDNTKRLSYLAFAELPRLTSQPLELAVHMSAEDAGDRQRMQSHGWRLRHASEVSRTPEMYRSYIQRSRGEISCVKPSCVKLRNGWISDRSLCYLASGKPVVMQDTGPNPYLPFGKGIFRFSTPYEAAEALATVNADYETHCLAAREIAETYFDARQTAERILNIALA
ncbi:hypothetical protein GA0070624_4429 [Micromonospora rhizosphaerae]|uniref:Glycosyl transferases group 1 n=1 Tax=Micromonospora rhizosphaerae TaxID=568872 RepID=A0A1C6SRK2_9ACTN|nr:hypothetical protein [Micromonospora rhizosphaerae]SCL32254.1 hypothetical protein GA0070624_4429 [Micromonospora rhizosphaerae]